MALYVKNSGAWQALPDRNAVYVKVAGAWVMIGLPAPSVPTGLAAVPGPGTATMTWNAATVAAPLSISGYELRVDGVERSVGNVLSYEWTGLPAVKAVVSVRSVASYGDKSEWSAGVSFTPSVPYNNATGGTVTEVANYNGTGQRWMVHTFTGGGTLNVSRAAQPFRVLVVGGSGGGGSGADGSLGYGGGGGGGGGAVDTSIELTTGAIAVTVGGQGVTQTSIYEQRYGGGGGTSSLGSYVSAAGGGGGHSTWHAAPNSKGGNSGAPQSRSGGTVGSSPGGGGGGAGGNASGGSAGPGMQSNITGANAAYGGGGGGGGSGWLHGWAGAAGLVIVAYQIG